MLKPYIISTIVFGSLFVGATLPLNAQQTGSGNPGGATASPATPAPKDVYFVNRAKNLARQSAINANGGLNKYRPDPIMYGPAVQTPYRENPDGSVTFTFTGGTPGAAPTIETEATVRPDGLVTLDYNGSVRNANMGGPLPSNTTSANTPTSQPSATPTSNPTVAPSGQAAPGGQSIGGVSQPQRPAVAWADEDSFLTRARNLARQAAISANGGLDKYRPEDVMFGPAARSPHTKNPDGSLTFSFKGNTPGAGQPSFESVITVQRNGTVAVQYNGPIRQP
jgi:hypothetical protein